MKISKIKNLLLVGLTVLGLSACTNEIDNTIEDANGDINGYISLSITSPQTRTSGTTTPDTDGTESDINNVTIVLTDAEGNIKKAMPATMKDDKKVTEPIEVPVGEFYVYALINRPTEVKAAGNIQQVIAIADANKADATNGYKNGKFFMVNAKHNAATNAGIKANVATDNDKDNPLKVSINVDRVSVKILPKVSTPAVSIAELVKSVEMKGYHLLNVNKQFNVIQKWGTSNYRNKENITISEALETPFHNEDKEFDKQYFHSISDYTTVTTVTTDDNTKEITSIVDKKVEPIALGKVIYATENRPEIMTYTKNGKKLPTSGKAETTGVIYQVQAKSDATTNLGTFYEYNGLVYTDIAEVEKATGVAEDTYKNMDIGVLRTKDVRVYEKGIMYYTYFIKDKQINSNHQWGTENANYNGVFRNSVYNLDVTKLTKLGDDVPGGVIDPENPNPPIDTDEAYIEVSVKVNPWVLNTIDIDF